MVLNLNLVWPLGQCWVGSSRQSLFAGLECFLLWARCLYKENRIMCSDQWPSLLRYCFEVQRFRFGVFACNLFLQQGFWQWTQNGRLFESGCYLDGCRFAAVFCVLLLRSRGVTSPFYFEALGIFSAFFYLKCGLHLLCASLAYLHLANCYIIAVYFLTLDFNCFVRGSWIKFGGIQ